jgi:hypothetical protein
MSYPIVKTSKAKTIAAAVGGLATVVAAVFADDVLDTSEIGNLIAGLVAFGGTVTAVFAVPNKPVR